MIQIEKINPTWGVKVQFDTVNELFNKPLNFWKQMLYDSKLVIIKHATLSPNPQYEMVGKLFGIPSYDPSPASQSKVARAISYYPFSNKTDPRIGTQAMVWHADFPNFASNPFPIRTLWMTANPNPLGGITGFLNLTDSIPLLSKELQELIPRITVIQQDWFVPSTGFKEKTNLQELSFLKIHPITGEKTLRLNMYNVPGKVKDGWICGVKIDGVDQPDCSLIQVYLDAILAIPGMSYFHTWDMYDLIAYDNWTSVHNRTALNLADGEERVLSRININHDLNFEYVPRSQFVT